MNTLEKLIEQIVAEELRNLDESPESRGAFAQDLRDMGLGQAERAIFIADRSKIGRPLKQLFHKHADHDWMDRLLTIHFLSAWKKPSDFFKGITSKDELSCTAFLPGHKLTKKDFWRDIGLVVDGRITFLANDMDDVFSGHGAEYTQLFPNRTRDSGANKGIEKRRAAEDYERHPYLVLDKDDWKKHPHRSNEALVDNWRPVALIFKYPDKTEMAQLANVFKEQGIDIPMMSIEEFNKQAIKEATSLKEKRRRRKRRKVSTGQTFAPVYHAGKREPDLTRPTYWAERPRTTEFGKTVTKAEITMKQPYDGWEGDARQIAHEVGEAVAAELVEDITMEPWEEDIYDSPEEQLAELLSQEHAEGHWQHKPVIRAIRGADFDGVISNDPFGGETEYVTFSPEQVKILDVSETD